MDTLRAIEGIEIFPVISLLLFVIVFTVMIVRAVRLDRGRLDQYARIPLGDADAAGPSAPHSLSVRE